MTETLVRSRGAVYVARRRVSSILHASRIPEGISRCLRGSK
jgi:hypothetical protein